MNRRKFLRAAAAGSLLGYAGSAGAFPFQFSGVGTKVPAASGGRLLGRRFARRRFKVIEIFLAGAASHRDSLWVEPLITYNAPERRALADVVLDDVTLASTDRYAIGSNPGASEDIGLGPWGKVFDGTNWLSRARLVTMGHDRPVHRLAQFHALTGQTLGRDASASMGAWLSNDTWSTAFPSFVLVPRPSAVPHALMPALRTTQAAPVAPVLVPFASSGFTDAVMAHAADPNREAVASIRSALRGDFQASLTHSSGEVLRSGGFSAYEGAASLLDQAPELEALLGAAQLTLSDTPDYTMNYSRLASRFAGELLGVEGGPRHVCIVDGGITQSFDHHGTGSFETEGVEQSSDVNASLYSLFRELVGSVDLDETIVVVHTDFGRTWLDGETTGHWSDGYAALVIGGPIGLGRGGVVGGMSYTETAVDNVTKASFGGSGRPALSPSDLRAALLHACGSSMADVAVPSADLHPDLGTAAAVYDAIFGSLS